MCTEDDRPSDDSAAAARAYLQRAEVRLSTLHRIAGVFLNGAGLLVLFPVLVTQVVSGLIFVLSYAPFPASARVLFLMSLSLVTLLPVYSLTLLFKELVQFYYVTRHDDRAGYDPKKFFPRFTLTGLALPPDETPDRKRTVLGIQYSGRFTDFLIPRHPRKRHYYSLVSQQYGTALPPLTTRSRQSLNDAGVVIDVPDDEFATLSTALRMTGFEDRSLDEEAAKMEFSISRHLVYLRTLVLRYFKALILLVVSTLVLAVVAGVAPKMTGGVAPQSGRPLFYPADSTASATAIAGLFLLWSVIVVIGIRRPVEWIYELADPSTDVGGTHRFDPELVRFETAVKFVAGFVALLNIQALAVFALRSRVGWIDSSVLWLTVGEVLAWVALGLILRATERRRYEAEVGSQASSSTH